MALADCNWQQNKIVNFDLFTVNQILFAGILSRDPLIINWLTASNFRDRAFFIHTELLKTSGSTTRSSFSQTTRFFLARE
jgi:hypothetical protein